jgi:hypothetical protein
MACDVLDANLFLEAWYEVIMYYWSSWFDRLKFSCMQIGLFASNDFHSVLILYYDRRIWAYPLMIINCFYIIQYIEQIKHICLSWGCASFSKAFILISKLPGYCWWHMQSVYWSKNFNSDSRWLWRRKPDQSFLWPWWPKICLNMTLGPKKSSHGLLLLVSCLRQIDR